jgi:hypothetical protein
MITNPGEHPSIHSRSNVQGALGRQELADSKADQQGPGTKPAFFLGQGLNSRPSCCRQLKERERSCRRKQCAPLESAAISMRGSTPNAPMGPSSSPEKFQPEFGEIPLHWMACDVRFATCAQGSRRGERRRRSATMLLLPLVVYKMYLFLPLVV